MSHATHPLNLRVRSVSAQSHPTCDISASASSAWKNGSPTAIFFCLSLGRTTQQDFPQQTSIGQIVRGTQAKSVGPRCRATEEVWNAPADQNGRGAEDRTKDRCFLLLHTNARSSNIDCFLGCLAFFDQCVKFYTFIF